ncbi:MAG: hypothetical protein ACREJO_05845 [Phycisphaerales bacterium]
MSKWIKKNAKYFLIAFGILLMIVFIVPQGFWQAEAGSAVLYTIDGHGVTQTEAQHAGDAQKTYAGIRPGQAAALGLTGNDPIRMWILLTEQARRAGLAGTGADAEPLIEDVALAMGQRQLQEDFAAGRLKDMPANQQDQMAWVNRELEARAASARSTISSRLHNQIAPGMTGLDALSKGRSVERMIEQYVQTPALSEQRFAKAAREVLDSAKISYLIIPVDENAAKARPALTETELVAFYDKYRDVPAGTGEYGIGYRQPNRVRLAWLKIDRRTIQSLVTVDPIEVQKLLMAAKPVPGQETAERNRIESEIRTRLTDTAMNVARDAFKRYALQSIAKLHDDGIYKSLPTDFPPFNPAAAQAAILAELADKCGVRINSLSTGSSSNFQTLADVAKDPQIGSAAFHRGADRKSDIPLAAALSTLKEFNPKPTAVSIVRVPVQVGVPIIDPFEDASGNLIYVCVTASKPEAAPTSIDEVREQLVTDKKKVDAMTELDSQGAAYALVAADMGMSDLETQLKNKGLAVSLVKNVDISRSNGVRPVNPLLNNEKFLDAVMDHAEKLDVGQKFDQSNAISRTFAVPLPAALSVAIVQITEYTPLTQEKLRAVATQGIDRLRNAEISSRPADWPFTFNMVSKRLNYKEVAPSKDKDKDKATDLSKPDQPIDAPPAPIP